MVLDVAKAFLRGQFIHLNSIKTTTKAWKTSVIAEAGRVEEAYIVSPSDDSKRV